MKLCTITVLTGTVLCMLPAPHRGLGKKIPIRMPVQARVTEAVVVVIGPQVVDDVVLQRGVGPYAGRVRVGVIPFPTIPFP